MNLAHAANLSIQLAFAAHLGIKLAYAAHLSMKLAYAAYLGMKMLLLPIWGLTASPCLSEIQDCLCCISAILHLASLSTRDRSWFTDYLKKY